MRRDSIITLCNLSASLIAVAATLAGAPLFAVEAKVDFSKQIKPILSTHCFACHGPDKKSREAELRLDLRDEAIKEAIRPGVSAKSELLSRITTDDPDEMMPPNDSKKPRLTEEEVALVKRWIDEGAEYSEHWAFVPPNRSTTKNPAAAIDELIKGRLAIEGLKPASEADRRTLIRRLSFDLTGLPPTPAEVDAFVADKSPDAYEQLVDRLLASKHYGERMAVYWLDLVRYADTSGYHGDNNRDHTAYRDYVIDAFNKNKKYDVFTREQLAGDLLPNATSDQKIASGFNRLNQTTREGGAQPKEYIAIYAADRVRNNNSIFLGLSMGCCQCHDHKFDPLTARDFYSFAAFFADIQEVPVGAQKPVVLLNQQQMQRDYELNGIIATTQKLMDGPSPQIDAAQAAWEKALNVPRNAVAWSVLEPTHAVSSGGATLAIGADGAILASGKSPLVDTYTVTFDAALKDVTALRLEVLPHASLAAKGPGRAANGNIVLSEFNIKVDEKPVALTRATATHSQKSYTIDRAIDGNAGTGWAILPQVGSPNTAIFSVASPIGNGTKQAIKIAMVHNYGTAHTIGHFRVSATTSKSPHGTAGVRENIAAVLAIDSTTRNKAQLDLVRKHFRATATITADLREKIDDAQKEKAALVKQAVKILISMTMKPRVTRILNRGDWQDETGEIVQPAVPAYLGSIPLKEGQLATRVDLANWMASPTNPLTARVMVNRLWKLMFGRGLVGSLGDFGAQGEVPTHSELLDWLAIEFTENGWDIKRMLKLIAMSNAYRQSSDATPAELTRDPGNKLLARQGRWRLDAEFVRDNALAISGLLSRKVGGPSVRPYQPTGYLTHLNFPRRTWKHDTGENQYRRGLYTFWQRTFLHPSLAAFDAPSREECTVERPNSNTPLQALVLLNDPTYVEAGRELARRMISEGGKTDAERLKFAFREVLSRDMTATESQALAALVNKHWAEFKANPAEAAKIQKIGLAPGPVGIDPAELAAWTSAARTILNLHETITRN
jgi:hypothetical protein